MFNSAATVGSIIIMIRSEMVLLSNFEIWKYDKYLNIAGDVNLGIVRKLEGVDNVVENLELQKNNNFLVCRNSLSV